MTEEWRPSGANFRGDTRMTKRCSCPSAYGICDGPQIDCSVHGTVDGILASGWYVDRKSRPWHLRHDSKWQCDLGERKVCLVTGWYMRLLIERDLHRDECPSLIACENHPVPCVTIAGGPYGCFHVNPADTSDETYVAHECTHERAMDAARKLAVGE